MALDRRIEQDENSKTRSYFDRSYPDWFGVSGAMSSLSATHQLRLESYERADASTLTSVMLEMVLNRHLPLSSLNSVEPTWLMQPSFNSQGSGTSPTIQ